MRLSTRLLIVALAPLLTFSACSDQPAVYAPDGQPSVLSGQFGGRLLEVTATDTAAHFKFVCAYGRTTPLQRSIEGLLEASGTSTSVSAGFVTEPLYVTATLNGDILSLTVTIGTDSRLRIGTYLLQRNVPGDFSGWACAA
jgi:hypothetical protein